MSSTIIWIDLGSFFFLMVTLLVSFLYNSTSQATLPELVEVLVSCRELPFITFIPECDNSLI